MFATLLGIAGLGLVFGSGFVLGTDPATQSRVFAAIGIETRSPVGPAAAAVDADPAGRSRGSDRSAGVPSGGPSGAPATSLVAGAGVALQQSATGLGRLAGDVTTQDASSGGPSDRTLALPTSVSIPALGLRRDLIGLNVIEGSLQVPERWGDVGWWQSGPTPGERGSAVLVGHVDSPTGPAVFYELSTLVEGDTIVVKRADGSTATFRVDSNELVSREDFPSQEVYRRDGRPTLHVLTCGGAYDETNDRYTDNLVLTAYLVSDDADQRSGDQGRAKGKDADQGRANGKDADQGRDKGKDADQGRAKGNGRSTGHGTAQDMTMYPDEERISG